MHAKWRLKSVSPYRSDQIYMDGDGLYRSERPIEQIGSDLYGKGDGLYRMDGDVRTVGCR